ncbi:MAG: hypothetical protein N2595_02165 [bacterium]|nr:hypothetical protein [bacterium]
MGGLRAVWFRVGERAPGPAPVQKRGFRELRASGINQQFLLIANGGLGRLDSRGVCASEEAVAEAGAPP